MGFKRGKRLLFSYVLLCKIHVLLLKIKTNRALSFTLSRFLVDSCIIKLPHFSQKTFSSYKAFLSCHQRKVPFTYKADNVYEMLFVILL